MKTKTLTFLDFETNRNIIEELVDNHINNNKSDNIDWYIMVIDYKYLNEIPKLTYNHIFVIKVSLDNLDSTISSLIKNHNLKENKVYMSLPLYLEGAIVIYSEQIKN